MQARPRTVGDYVLLSDGTLKRRADLESKGLVGLSSGEWVPKERAKTLTEEWKAKDQFRLTRLDDLLSKPTESIAYLWDDTLIKGGLSLLVAKPKVGKSTMARNLVS